MTAAPPFCSIRERLQDLRPAPRALDGVSPGRRARRDGRPDRPVRLGQVHPAALHQRPADHRRRRGRDRGLRRPGAGRRPGHRPGARGAHPHRLHLPAVQPGRPPDPVHQRRAGLAGPHRRSGAACSACGRAETKHAAMAALHRVGVADYAGQRANTLSGGQQQRGAIARALVQKAKIILADEPVASLDPVSARKVMEILRDLNQTRRPDRGRHPAPGRLRPALLRPRGGAEGRQDRLRRPGRRPGPSQLIDIYGPEFEDVFWEGAPR